MKPTRRLVRRSFMGEVTGGFGAADAPGGAGKAMPPTDSDLHLPGKHGPKVEDRDSDS